MKVFFLEQPPRCEVKFELKQIPGGARREIRELAAAHREALFEEWDANVQSSG